MTGIRTHNHLPEIERNIPHFETSIGFRHPFTPTSGGFTIPLIQMEFGVDVTERDVHWGPLRRGLRGHTQIQIGRQDGE